MNLVETLVAVGLIAVLAVVSLPMLARANNEARSAACRANLMTLGQHLDQYQTRQGTLPALMNRDDRALEVPTLDRVLDLPVAQRSVLQCPSDNTDCFERTGTSYGWFAAWDHQAARVGDPSEWPNLPILADKAPFHSDQPTPYNALYPAQVVTDDMAQDAPTFMAAPCASPY